MRGGVGPGLQDRVQAGVQAGGAGWAAGWGCRPGCRVQAGLQACLVEKTGVLEKAMYMARLQSEQVAPAIIVSQSPRSSSSIATLTVM